MAIKLTSGGNRGGYSKGKGGLYLVSITGRYRLETEAGDLQHRSALAGVGATPSVYLVDGSRVIVQ